MLFPILSECVVLHKKITCFFSVFLSFLLHFITFACFVLVWGFICLNDFMAKKLVLFTLFGGEAQFKDLFFHLIAQNKQMQIVEQGKGGERERDKQRKRDWNDERLLEFYLLYQQSIYKLSFTTSFHIPKRQLIWCTDRVCDSTYFNYIHQYTEQNSCNQPNWSLFTSIESIDFIFFPFCFEVNFSVRKHIGEKKRGKRRCSISWQSIHSAHNSHKHLSK